MGKTEGKNHLEVLGVDCGTLLEWVKAIEQAMNAQADIRGSCTLPLTSALDGGVWSTPCPDRFTPGKDLVLVVQEIWWVPGPVWAGAEYCTSQPGFNPRTFPARGKSLYRLRYSGPPIKRGPPK